MRPSLQEAGGTKQNKQLAIQGRTQQVNRGCQNNSERHRRGEVIFRGIKHSSVVHSLDTGSGSAT